MTHSLQIFGLLVQKNGKHHLLGETWRVNWESLWTICSIRMTAYNFDLLSLLFQQCFRHNFNTLDNMFQGSVEYIQPVFLRPSRGTSPVMTTKKYWTIRRKLPEYGLRLLDFLVRGITCLLSLCFYNSNECSRLWRCRPPWRQENSLWFVHQSLNGNGGTGRKRLLSG